jgi:SAM-dependent methyltransferase
MASLRPGEVVVDLGCGGGLDIFLAAQKVGPTGNAIGIDMTPAMIERAKNSADAAHYKNVEFHLATIDKLPLADSSVDVVISNCVINLAADKQAVFREIARVLKPGGRLAVSDIALKKPLPPEIAASVMAYVGCIAGAIQIDEYRKGLTEAGFTHVQVMDAGSDLNAYSKVEGQAGCCSPTMEKPVPLAIASCCGEKVEAIESGCCTPVKSETSEVHTGLADLIEQYNVNEYAASVKVLAVKPL